MALALGLYRDGRRRESLLALRNVRDELRDTAGLAAGLGIARLETMILADDRRLIDIDPILLVGPLAVHPASAGVTSEIFVGRDDVLDSIFRHLLVALDSRQGLWLDIVAAEGMGKTSLGERVALRAALEGWHVVSASCRPSPMRLLEPLGDLIQQVLGHEPNPQDVLDHDLLTDLSTLWLPASDKSARGDLGEAFIQAIEQHSERFALIVIVDDAHHLSNTPRRLLGRIDQLRTPVILITLGHESTAQPVALGPGGLMAGSNGNRIEVSLEGLEPSETARLLEILTGEVVSDDVAAIAHSASRGNPQLIRQLAFSDSSNGTRILLPAPRIALDALTMMSTAAQRVATVLALAGGPLSAETIVAAIGSHDIGATQAAIAEGLRDGIFREDSDRHVRLSGDALRTAVLETISTAEQIDLHDRIGQALTACGASPLAIAPHFVAAAERDVERAINAAHAAAGLAHQATMFTEASLLFQQAADLARRSSGTTDTRSLNLLLRQAESMRMAGDPASTNLVRQVADDAERSGDTDTFALAAAALCKLGPLTAAGPPDKELAALIERAIHKCTSDGVRAHLTGQATLFYSMTGQVDLCRSYFIEALTHARASGDAAAVLDALGNTYVSLTHPKDWGLRADLASEMLALAEHLDDDHGLFEALHLYFSTQVQTGDPLLRTTFMRQVGVARTLRTAGRRWMLGYQSACLAHLDNRLDEAVAISTETLNNAPVDISRAFVTHWMNLLVVRLAQGRGQELASDIDHIVTEQPGTDGWRAVAAWLAALRGDATRVRYECDLADGGRTITPNDGWSGAVMLLGRSVAAIGDTERCRTVTSVLRPYSGLMTWYGSGTVGPTDLALAEMALTLNQPDQAQQFLTVAQRCVHRLGAKVFQPDLDHVAKRLDLHST